MVKQVKDNKAILLKVIKDIVRFLRDIKQSNLSIFMPKERTLIIFICAYFDGDISKSIDKAFL